MQQNCITFLLVYMLAVNVIPVLSSPLYEKTLLHVHGEEVCGLLLCHLLLYTLGHSCVPTNDTLLT